MKRDAYGSPITNPHHALYNLALAPAASSSSTSLWSDAGSQHSDDSNTSATVSEADSCDSCFSRAAPSSQSSISSIGSTYEPAPKVGDTQPRQRLQQPPTQPEIPKELRQNPRRSSSVASRTGRPPTLVRQADRKVNFVDNLVDSATHIVEAIWPTSSVIARNEHGGNAVLPLRTFIQETLRRSRTSYSTLQVALYYLILIKPHVPNRDFTMEQPDDCHSSQALQCGRRMFLAALILASKYLQDRNYSARAWSKISGLHTHEINQNEIAFVLAVNWKLHITDEIYNRWTECVMKFVPPQPPSAGGTSQFEYELECETFRKIILTLTPELDNLSALDTSSDAHAQESALRSLLTPSTERTCAFIFDGELAYTPKPSSRGYTPVIMEPSPATVYTPGRYAPALGLLPTPRLTPQSSGFSTPAVSATSHLLAKNSMSLAMAHASSAAAAQALDRWSPSTTPSPQAYFTRRSSLANSISTASSPESMVSDSSRLSRSSSISSASSVSAPSAKLDVLARCRYAKLCGERSSLKSTIVSVPEDQEMECLVLSPESFAPNAEAASHGRKLRNAREAEEAEAARALQNLYAANRPTMAQPSLVPKPAVAPVRAGSKRNRAASLENSLHLQENVRGMLSGGERAWSNELVRPRPGLAGVSQQVAVRASTRGSRKRLCCSSEAAEPFVMSSLHPAMGGVGGPGMWGGILP